MKTSPAFLYLLVYPTSKMFKVGKSVDVHYRAKTLGRTWGNPCSESSCSLKLPDEESAYKVERGLKNLLHEFSMKFSAGDGKTEFFRLDMLDVAIEYINTYCASSTKDISLTRTLSQIIPIRRESKQKSFHVNKVNFFICNLILPIFNLNTHGKPSIKPLGMTSADGLLHIDVIPSNLGRPTQLDKDLLIYVMGLALQNGKHIVTFRLYDYLMDTAKDTGGSSYKRAKESLMRLSTALLRIKESSGKVQECHILENVKLVPKLNLNSQDSFVEAEVSDWVYDTITLNKLHSINPLYFKLKKPTERALYEVASKHCGNSKHFKISTQSLIREMGINSTTREFRRVLKNIFNEDKIPDYSFSINNDLVTINSNTGLPRIQ